MRKFAGLLIIISAIFGASPVLALDHYEIDKGHTHIIFLINHLGYSNMLGMFTDYNGTFQFDPKHAEESVVEMTLHPSGIHTTSEILDHVLQGENFFNSGKYPDIHFVSTGIKITGDHAGDVMGNVTMLGVTKPLTLHVVLNKADYQPVTNLFVAGFSAHADLKRSDFGMNYGIPMVGDDVHIEIEMEAVDQERKNAEKIQHKE